MTVAVGGGIITALALLYSLLFENTTSSIRKFVRKNILTLGFLISLSAVVSSLVYSEVIGYLPCILCWWARVFFYPQVVIFGIALVRKDKSILPYSLGITFIGLLFSTYHYIVESIGSSPLPCEAGGVSCLVRYVHEFGFITIPLMGLIGFLVLLLALLAASPKKLSTSNSQKDIV